MSNKTDKEKQTVREIVRESITSDPEQTLEDLADVVHSELGYRPAKATLLVILAGLGRKAKRVTRWEKEDWDVN